MRPRITILTGSFPPDVCGVGDYTHELVQQLRVQGAGVDLFHRGHWSLLHLLRYINEIRSQRPDVLNIQYPTEGYGYSILPQLICAFGGASKKVVTLHEFSKKSFKGKLAIYLFFLCADWTLFTTEEERNIACRVAPWLKKKSSVVNIASNIPLQDSAPPETDLVYFGLIRPVKGLEEFSDIVAALRKTASLKVRVVGKIVPGYEKYAAEILDRLRADGVEILLDLPAGQVAELLRRSKIALLPFPDGVTLRRGSALAAMGNGALVITTSPAGDKRELSPFCVMASSKEDFCRSVMDALRAPERYEAVRSAAREFARTRSWMSVAKSYHDVFSWLYPQ